jgi:primase-polymerase (primpol)-like protein
MKLQNIPKELQDLKQWVCSYHNSKIPRMAKCNRVASSIEPDTWSTFQDAVKSVEYGNYDNVGFVFNSNGIVGIDVDDGYDEYGFLTPLASDIIRNCCSYTEKSRSGRGVHILVKGTLPFGGKNNLSGVEIYQQSRYFILTGDVILYKDIVENQDAIDYIVEKYFSVAPKVSNNKPYTDRIYTPEWTKSSDKKIKLRPHYPRIPEGCRNICLTSLAGMLHNLGYTRQQILDELIYCNKVACKPMLYERELHTIANSVTRYKR